MVDGGYLVGCRLWNGMRGGTRGVSARPLAGILCSPCASCLWRGFGVGSGVTRRVYCPSGVEGRGVVLVVRAESGRVGLIFVGIRMPSGR